jgi:isoleucyl-tRNA synthetase
MGKYTEYEKLNLPKIGDDIRDFWEKEHIFEQSMETREGQPEFVFFEGPPSANGLPGIHHVMARTIKDMVCRYQTLKGKHVSRKAGWDTHGLPVELGVEKTLGITKEDIGKSISVEDYNKACRTEVMKYKSRWDDLTRLMGYWVSLKDPYITFDTKYMESVWYLLSQFYEKGLLYKGYTIQPYSPAAGTGLSSHELNLPGCYRDVKDTTVVAQFRICPEHLEKVARVFGCDTTLPENTCFLAWTTTPWTLPSNTALAVGTKIDYVLVQTFNPYTGTPVNVILARELLPSFFPEKNGEIAFEDYHIGDKNIPFRLLGTATGEQLLEIHYEQLIPYVYPEKGAFRVIAGDYVTTEDGTGIVHIAPTFGADDKRVAAEAGVPPLMLLDTNDNLQPMVDKTGKFYPIENLHPDFVARKVNVPLYEEVAGRFVKPEYEKTPDPTRESLDIYLSIWLKKQGKAFKIEKYTHSYPHCWRTDKPVLYYPLDSWFIKTTAFKDRMLELNQTIHWKPASTGSGRFGNWLDNLVDWNLSRSRFWGVPLPIWRTEDHKEQICIASLEQLKTEIAKAIHAGVMDKDPYEHFIPGDFSKENYDKVDLHKPYVDQIVLVSASGQKMFREPDLIDVWFDSGAMPYCQWHYPFENKDVFSRSFPADFIAEGVDQTRGWFFTLHAIATMLFDSIAYKNVVSNGLVLDKNGNKMSKRLQNAVDPFETIKQYGPDATRWYMMTNTQPWENLKFDKEGIGEAQRKFFGTLYNTYSFFALYANIDGFEYREQDIPVAERPEIDRWILSELNTLIEHCDDYYADYEPTRVGRDIQQFVDEYLSNWYVRLCRRRFWKGDYSADKISAYQTLYTCLTTIAKLAAPIAPFFMDRLFIDLNRTTGKEPYASVHLANFPVANQSHIDHELEERMQLAQKISSMTLSLRKKSNLRVRQPLNKIMLPALDAEFKKQIERVKSLILHEVNVKELQFINEDDSILVKRVKPDFKLLGPRYGKIMKSIAAQVGSLTRAEIATLEKQGEIHLLIENEDVLLTLNDVEIIAEDIPGWVVTNQGQLTVALDITLTEDLKQEGYTRELVNRIQNYRKDTNWDVTDHIKLTLQEHPVLTPAFVANENYIKTETLCDTITFNKNMEHEAQTTFEIAEGLTINVLIEKM